MTRNTDVGNRFAQFGSDYDTYEMKTGKEMNSRCSTIQEAPL